MKYDIPPIPEYIPFYVMNNQFIYPIVFKHGSDYYCISNHRFKGEPFGYTKVGTPDVLQYRKRKVRKLSKATREIYQEREKVSMESTYFWKSVFPRLTKTAKYFLKHENKDDLRWIFLPLFEEGVEDITQPFSSNIRFTIWENWDKEVGIKKVISHVESVRTGLPTDWDLFGGHFIILQDEGLFWRYWGRKQFGNIYSGKQQLVTIRIPKLLVKTLLKIEQTRAKNKDFNHFLRKRNDGQI
jgi:hypothetical protein